MKKIRKILIKILNKVSPEYQKGYLDGIEAGIKISIHTLKSSKQLTLDYIKRQREFLEKQSEGDDEVEK